MSAVRNRANGSAHTNGAAVQSNSAAKDHPYENIFLFIPNLIGSSLPSLLGTYLS
jgi:CDP-diacylglycerol--inositol 3-phosphatidyltransferase